MNLFGLLKPKSKVWLARSSVSGDYVISIGYKLKLIGGYWKAFDSKNSRFANKSLCPRDFEKIVHKSCLLEPGDGPIKIEISIKQSLYNKSKRIIMLEIARCILVCVQSNILIDSGFHNLIRRVFPSFPRLKWCDHLGFTDFPWSLSEMPYWHAGYDDIRGRYDRDLFHGHYYGDKCPVCLYGEPRGWKARYFINIVLIRAFGKTLSPNVKPGTFVLKRD